uniref:Lysosomal dipeptide transporter MFSD1 n=1 Tax=Arcella intermedia TaxID=1963864 RepID=A0A6B2LDT2_9EUKA
MFCVVNPLFSVYYCYDSIGSLGPYLIQSGVLSTEQLSSLISIYSIVPLVAVLVTGVLVDLTGLRAVFIYSLVLVVSGNTILALAFKANTFWMMIVGRVIMGSAESAFVVSLALLGLLFKENITVATSIGITWGQIGAVLVFIIQPAVYSSFGLFKAMMVPIGSALFSLSTSLLLLTIDILFLGNTTAKTTQTEKLHLSDLKNFSLEFWMIMVGNTLPTGAFIVSQTLGSLYLVEWGLMEEQEAGYVVGVANMIQLGVPLVGRLFG